MIFRKQLIFKGRSVYIFMFFKQYLLLLGINHYVQTIFFEISRMVRLNKIHIFVYSPTRERPVDVVYRENIDPMTFDNN